MQVLIDIPAQVKTEVDEAWNPVMLGNAVILNVNAIANAIRNGVVLPEHNDRLVDADKLDDAFYEYTRGGDFGYHQAQDLINAAPTIIESSEGEE